jgi:hypothetical protein
VRARRVLAEAMDVCDRNQIPVPCKANPVLWSDENATQPARQEMAKRCRRCPVLAECRAFLKQCETDRVSLNGVVAGVTLREGKRVEPRNIQPARGPNRLGGITVQRAMELLEAGETTVYVAMFAGVSENAVSEAVARFTRQEKAGAA